MSMPALNKKIAQIVALKGHNKSANLKLEQSYSFRITTNR